MVVPIDNAEDTLLQTLQKYYTHNTEHSCLYIRGSLMNERSRTDVLEDIARWAGPQQTELYICQNQDIFILSTAFTSDIFENLKKRLKIQFSYDEKLLSRLVSHYDIQLNGMGLIALARAAKNKKEEQDERKRVRDKVTKRMEFLNANPRPDLVATLSARKAEHTKPEILVIEDDPFTRRLVTTSIGPGFAINYADNGQDAVTEYLYRAPNIVFLDIGLPDVSGQDVLAKLLSLDPVAFIIMLSGNSQSENVTVSIKTGAKGFIGKPFTKEKLFQYIHKCPSAASKMQGAPV